MEPTKELVFRRYSLVGGYPMYYLDSHSNVYCADCATLNRDEIVRHDANWEAVDLFCDECGEQIEAAYC